MNVDSALATVVPQKMSKNATLAIYDFFITAPAYDEIFMRLNVELRGAPKARPSDRRE
ncbi:hypothetical protein SKTS_18870 [Sulfurimicrobium lacus]|uniref:Uncharacterized protein n=1 Tax=Sulfurimicrobium lacus TaxID=2715678 RepID=A0A6F8VCX6_9PROT|nr:hypothetical protein SKTS_18870 [Sulfurimicrobium lacus]